MNWTLLAIVMAGGLNVLGAISGTSVATTLGRFATSS